MKRTLATALAMVFVLSGLLAGGAHSRPEGAFQAGLGIASISGTPSMGISYDLLTVHAAGLYFPSPWAAMIFDFSYGFPHNYNFDSGSSLNELQVQASYLDAMVGFHSTISGGGFLYIGAGLSVGWSDLDIEGSDSVYEIDSGIGPVVGFGVQIPVRDTFGGFASVRHRFIDSKFKFEDNSYDMSVGGPQIIVGCAWTFGE